MRVSVPNLKGLPEFGEASHRPDACLNCWSLHIWASCLASKEPRETAGALWVCMGQSYCKNWCSCAGFGVTVSIQTQGAQKELE